MSSPIIRRRTGCVVCRKRRIKCDESKPSCRNCVRNSQCCSWMKDLRFVHESNSFAVHGKNPNASKLSVSKKQNRRPSSNQDSKINGEIQVFTVQPYEELLSPPIRRSLSPQASSHASSISSGSKNLIANPSIDLFNFRSQTSISVMTGGPDTVSDYASFSNSSVTEICRSESAKLRNSIEIEHASPIPPNLNPNPEGFTDWNTLGVPGELQSALNSDIEVKLLQNYIWECAPWFDVHNSKRNYSKADVPRMMNCPPWRAAALALSAKNLELLRGKCTNYDSLSLHLYQLAVRLAIDSISGRFDCVGTLSGCVLLAVYEMMTVSYTDWRRHLQGCASIYIHNDWNGSTGGLISASFWDYARIDIWAAFCSATDTLICPSIWFDKPEHIMSLTDVNEDTHAQISTWLLGRTVNLVHRNHSPGSYPLFDEDFKSLRAHLSEWEAMGSSACRAIISRDANPDEDIPFPRILFSNHSSIIAHTMFHTAMVLLLEYELSKTSSSVSKTSEATYYHSRIACGIIETNDHTACLVNSLQPIYICGRHLRTRAEKFAALEILAQIEKRTGWKCDWRSKGLREFWKLC